MGAEGLELFSPDMEKHGGNAVNWHDSKMPGAQAGAIDFRGGPSWAEIRGLIAQCEELPASVRKAMIENGDLAVGHLAERRLMQ